MPTQYNRKYRDDVPDYLKGTKYTAPEKGDRTYDELKRNLDKSGMSMDEFEKWNNDKLSGRTDMNWEQYVEKRDATPDQKRYAAGQRYTDNEYYTDTYEPQVEDELAKYRQQMQGNLRDLKQQTNFAQERNDQYLDEQLKQYQRDQAQDKSQITALQNRRGGFYSGGLDYQLGQNNQAYTQARSGLTRDVASRNAELNAKYQNVAQDAYTKLSQLQQQAPDRVRELVQQALQGDREAAMAESQITGMYDGQLTLEAQKQQFDQAIQQQMTGLKAQAQEFDQNVQLQELAMQNAKLQLNNQQWQAEFEEDAKRWGMEYALQRAVQENRMSMEQAQQALNQSKFQWQQEYQQGQLNQGQQQIDQGQQRLDMQQQELQLDKQQFEQKMAQTSQQSPDIKPIIDQLNKMFVVEDPYNGEIKIENQEALEKAIMMQGLNEEQIASLYGMYGIPLD